MQKPLPPATWAALNPPASAAFPYTFFADAAAHPFQPHDRNFNLRNASWLMDAAFLSYSSEATIIQTWTTVLPDIRVRCFDGGTTQCYVAASAEWIILAWRGTQVDELSASVLDWLTDARFVPARDDDGHLVHSGFLGAINEVWNDVQAHIEVLQSERQRPLWITGHSLGAALATIASNRCRHLPELRLEGACTYGSPRVGAAAFGRVIATPVYRFQNNTDLVTHLPIGLVYAHVGQREFIDAGGHLHRNLALPDWLIPTDPVTLGSLRTLITGVVTRPAAVPGFLADHAPINYATLIWNLFDRQISS